MKTSAPIADLVWLESEIEEALLHLLSKPCDPAEIAKLEHCQSELRDDIEWLRHDAAIQQEIEQKQRWRTAA